jgi:dihydroorotase/N-acyl-D-amino-acid deacylase
MTARHFELLVRGGQLADGTGAPLRRTDVGVAAGTVTLLPAGSPATATRVLDASGHVVAPGFIDAHTHSDLTTLDGTGETQAHAAVLQGVTVEICGNCGDSAFPGRYRDFAAFARAHTATGRANHLVSLVGHGTVRGSVVGHEDRAATAAELAEMCRVLDEALGAGAAGLSSGLIYTPGSYADTAELTALASVAARHRKPYVTHLRDEMSQVEAALDEAVRIAREAGAALHVSHHKTAGKHAWGGTLRTLPRLNRLRASGMDVTCDVYPYTAGSTSLAAMLPPWAHDGGPELLLKRLSDPAAREPSATAAGTGSRWPAPPAIPSSRAGPSPRSPPNVAPTPSTSSPSCCSPRTATSRSSATRCARTTSSGC